MSSSSLRSPTTGVRVANASCSRYPSRSALSSLNPTVRSTPPWRILIMSISDIGIVTDTRSSVHKRVFSSNRPTFLRQAPPGTTKWRLRGVAPKCAPLGTPLSPRLVGGDLCRAVSCGRILCQLGYGGNDYAQIPADALWVRWVGGGWGRW